MAERKEDGPYACMCSGGQSSRLMGITSWQQASPLGTQTPTLASPSVLPLGFVLPHPGDLPWAWLMLHSPPDVTEPGFQTWPSAWV